jgi:UDP-N-acetylglucosamine transferase subunit ALG13
MIFVTVGMFPRQFDRLIRAADEMAARIKERVIMQRGSTAYRPESAQSFDFVREDRMQEWLADARVVVSHGGAGTILGVLQAGKPLVVVPRLARLGEHTDDHQLELAQVLAERGRAVSLANPSSETLWRAIEEATQLRASITVSNSLRTALHDWLGEQAERPVSRWSRLLRRGRQGG